MTKKKWLRLAIPAALLAFGATACSGDNTAQLDNWASTLCGAMQSPVQQAATALADTGTVKTGETPKALQTRLAADLGTLATANTDIAQAVQKAGAPKVSNGSQTQASAVSELNQAAGGYTKAQQDVLALSTTDQAKFAANLNGIGDQIQQQAELSTSALQQLQSGDAGKALAGQAACKSVNGSPTAAAGAPAASTPAATPSAGTSTRAGAKPSGSASTSVSSKTSPKPGASSSSH